jgi:nucleotide-binding universal stress UspA family protein
MMPNGHGPVVFAYDGSDLAKTAIEEASRQLGKGREALVLTVWQTGNVGFAPPSGVVMDAARAEQVRRAAKDTADAGAALAQAAGFLAEGIEMQAAPTWKGIVECADERGASLVVLGSHGKSGIASVLIGSVAQAVAAHSKRSVLIVH